MKKLVEALKTIQDECKSHGDCKDCPMSMGDNGEKCSVIDTEPDLWKINDKPQKVLL